MSAGEFGTTESSRSLVFRETGHIMFCKVLWKYSGSPDLGIQAEVEMGEYRLPGADSIKITGVAGDTAWFAGI